MPAFHHAVAGAFGRDGQAVKLARQADGKVANVDHFLHFAETFGRDLARLDRHQPAEIVLGCAKLLAEQAHQFATTRRGHQTPGFERLVGKVDGLGGVGRADGLQIGDLLAGYRRERWHEPLGVGGFDDTKLVQEGMGFLGDCHRDILFHRSRVGPVELW